MIAPVRIYVFIFSAAVLPPYSQAHPPALKAAVATMVTGGMLMLIGTLNGGAIDYLKQTYPSPSITDFTPTCVASMERERLQKFIELHEKKRQARLNALKTYLQGALIGIIGLLIAYPGAVKYLEYVEPSVPQLK